MPARADPGIPADPDMGQRLRAIRRRAGYDRAAFAHALGLSRDAYDRLERGEASLPPLCLPPLADLAQTSMATLLAELHGAPETAAELHTLVTAYNAIPTRMARDTLLTLALAYAESGW